MDAPNDPAAETIDDLPDIPAPPPAASWLAALDAPSALPAGSPDEPPPPPAQNNVIPFPQAQTVNTLAPLNDLRGKLQPIAADLLCDRAYWEQLKRNASPRTFLEFVRFAFAADLEGKAGGGNNTQVVIQAPFPRGPLDVLPPHMRIE